MVRAHCYHLSQSMEPKRPAGLYALLVSVALSCAPPPTRICLLVEWPQSHAEPVYFCPNMPMYTPLATTLPFMAFIRSARDVESGRPSFALKAKSSKV